jgi:hypothetical protein
MSKLKPSGAVGAYMVYARRSEPPIYEAQAYHDNSAQLRDVTFLRYPRAEIPLEDPTSNTKLIFSQAVTTTGLARPNDISNSDTMNALFNKRLQHDNIVVSLQLLPP